VDLILNQRFFEMEKVAIIGAGNLGLSIARGLIQKEILDYDSLLITKKRKSEVLAQEGFNQAGNLEAAKAAKVLILCVQPHQVKTILEEMDSELTVDHVLISTITGVSIELLSSYVDASCNVIRAMPNTAAAIASSMTCIASNEKSERFLDQAEMLFQSIGETLVIEEELMQAATVLGASGIAFFMRYLRAATQAGVQMGFDSEDAKKIAVQTAKGASLLIQELETHPEVEVDKVTTPKGCTIEGLNEMEHRGFSSSLIKGVMASYRKITEMKK